MKTYFPIPYPDELLYSVMSRCCKHLGLDNMEGVQSYLFGSKAIKPTIELPNRINFLVETTLLHLMCEAKQVVLEHTMFPYYAGFLGVEKRNKLLQAMLRDGPNKAFGQAGNFVRQVPSSSNLRYCPECIENDIRIYGEPYWHRIHQVPGIRVCPQHQLLLQERCVECQSTFSDKKTGFFSLDDNCLNGHFLGNHREIVNQKEYISYAEDAWRLLNTDKTYEGEELIKRFDTRLIELGYASIKGTVKQSQLRDDFIRFYTESYLNQIGCDIDESEGNWLFRAFRKNKSVQHPLRYLLVIRFLFGSFKEFESAGNQFAPFGKGPWACLNPTASHFRQNVITNCRVSKKNGETVGAFSCECGYAYSVHLNKEGNEKSDIKISKIKSLGEMFEAKVGELLLLNHQPPDIARMIPCEVQTVYYIQMKLNRKKERKCVSRDKLKPYRDRISDLASNKEKLSRKEIRKRAPKEYAWLFHYDRQWLRSHLPEKKKAIDGKVRLDWSQRDIELSKRLNEFITLSSNSNSKPERFTKRKFLKMTKVTYELLQTKLPKTSRTIQENMESLSDYYIRCIKWAADVIHQNGDLVTEKRIREMIGLNAVLNSQVQSVLDELKDG